MYLRQIEYIIAVSELQSFGQAAERCFITQSTLSTMIGRFEGEIGIKVFNRKTKPVTITKEGEQIIRQLKIVAKEVHNFKEVVKDLKGEISGIFKIGLIPTLSPYLLPHFLHDFMDKLPAMQFEISEITTEKIVEKIAQRELDVGIVSIPLQHPQLIEIPLFNEPFVLYDKASRHLGDRFDINEIDFHRLWLLEEGHCLRTQVEAICGLHRRHNLNRQLEYKSGTIDTLLKYIKRNDGITLLPYLSTLEFSEEERKNLRQFNKPVPARTIGLLVHQHFVKKRILDILQMEIQDKILPLLSTHHLTQRVISPI